MSDIAVDDIHVYYCSAKDNARYDVTHIEALSKWKMSIVFCLLEGTCLTSAIIKLLKSYRSRKSN